MLINYPFTKQNRGEDKITDGNGFVNLYISQYYRHYNMQIYT